MNKLKSIFSLILEAILFAFLGGIFLFVSLRLFHYFTFEPPIGNFSFIPIYVLVPLLPVIILLIFSFIFGKVIFGLLKKENLQWFYNLVFFIVAFISLSLYIAYLNISGMNCEFTIERFVSMGDLRQFILACLFLLLYSFLYQIIKTRIFSK